MFTHVFEFTVQDKNKNLEKTFFNWPLRFVKNCLNWSLKKVSKKVPKSLNCPRSLADFRGLNNSSYQISEATFQQAFFP